MIISNVTGVLHSRWKILNQLNKTLFIDHFCVNAFRSSSRPTDIFSTINSLVGWRWKSREQLENESRTQKTEMMLN